MVVWLAEGTKTVNVEEILELHGMLHGELGVVEKLCRQLGDELRTHEADIEPMWITSNSERTIVFGEGSVVPINAQVADFAFVVRTVEQDELSVDHIPELLL